MTIAALGLATVSQLLALAVPLYSLQLLDRVLNSRSVETLLMLTIGVGIAILVQLAFDWCRAMAHRDAADRLESKLARPLALMLRDRNREDDLARVQSQWATIRRFLLGRGPLQVIDGVFWPLYVAALFLIHPAFGAMAFAMGGVAAAQNLIGLEPAQSSTVSTAIRSVAQIAFLGSGALYVLGGDLTAGGMIAASILGGRTYALAAGALQNLPHAGSALRALSLLPGLWRKSEAESLEKPRPAEAANDAPMVAAE